MADKKRKWGKLVADGLTVIIIVGSLVVVGRRHFPRAEVAAGDPYGRVSDASELLTAGNAIGPIDATVTLVEFIDYECGVCAALERDLEQIRSEPEQSLRVVYRHLPLPRMHDHARSAAVAVECAAQQDAFRPMHAELLRTQRGIGVLEWTEFASRAGVADLSVFEKCMEGDSWKSRLREDSIAAASLNASATPTLVLNGSVLRGHPGQHRLRELLKQASVTSH
jgi:protein-disulfide isomerase